MRDDLDMEKGNEKGVQSTEAVVGLAVSKEAIGTGSVDAATVLKHAIDGDEALKAFANHQGTVIHIDEATNKRLLRKIDLHLMPVRWSFSKG